MVRARVRISVSAFIIGAVMGTFMVPAIANFTQSATATGSVGTATLAAPTGLSASGGVKLSWTATTSAWATGTRVFRSATSGGPYSQITQIVGLATTTYTDSPGRGSFFYVVQAYYSGNGANWTSANSSEVRGGIALIQSATAGGTATTVSATFAATPTAGDLLVAVIATRTTGTITGPSGWTSAINQGGSTAPNQAIFYKIAGSAESKTVSASTTATGNGNGLQIYEYRGVTTLDATGSTTGTGTAVASGSLTTTTANELVIAGLVSLGGTSVSAWTNTFLEEKDFTFGTTVTLFAGGDRISAAVGSQTTTATSTASGAWRGQVVAFR
jgi:hypothetical protein